MSARPSRERDLESLRRLADGDTLALETLWMDHADRVFRHALWVTRRREEAEDVVQTVFVRLAEVDHSELRNLLEEAVQFVGAQQTQKTAKKAAKKPAKKIAKKTSKPTAPRKSRQS